MFQLVGLMLVLIAWALIIGATSVRADKPCKQNCTIGSGYSSDRCQYYIDNQDWLPPKYAYATHCVCSNDALDSAPYQCVRKQLQIIHDATFSDAFKSVARQKLSDYTNNVISEGEYDAWSDSQFGGTVKRIHDQAFSNCCCLGTPASDYWWHGIFVWPAEPCFAIRTGQELLSACGCDKQG